MPFPIFVTLVHGLKSTIGGEIWDAKATKFDHCIKKIDCCIVKFDPKNWIAVFNKN